MIANEKSNSFLFKRIITLSNNVESELKLDAYRINLHPIQIVNVTPLF